MTEPSKAAKRKACEMLEDGVGNGFVDAPTALTALARQIQRASDVAKKAHAVLDGLIGTGAIRDGLQSLILPDEPLDDLTVVEGYQLQPDGTRARVRVALRDMRIVEDNGDD